MKLEIYTDASIRQFDNGRTFGCAGALCPLAGESRYTINPDSTNNKSELLAIYLGCELANEIVINNPGVYDEICLYSDSQFGIFGLTKWIYGWMKTMDSHGVMYGSNGQPVKNQELFQMILTYLSTNNLKISFMHQSGHVRYSSLQMLYKANETFRTSNGYYLKPEDIYKISYYNDIVDKTSRAKLDGINPDNFPENDKTGIELVKYCIPIDFSHNIIKIKK